MEPTRKIRVGVIFGGRSGEHEVSLVSATSVIRALDPLKYDVVPIGITAEGRWISSPDVLHRLKEKANVDNEPERFLLPEPHRQGLLSAQGVQEPMDRLDVVIPLIHGTYGEDGTLQGLLELANIPYVGAGVLASAVGMDKVIQKQLFLREGLHTPKFLWFPSSFVRTHVARAVSAAEQEFRYPLFVKPANTGSSVGISKVHNRKELRAGLAMAMEFDRKVIIEEGINDVREIEISVLGNDVPRTSVPGEIIPSNEFYDYDAKYVDGKSTAIIPARLPRRIVTALQHMAVKAYKAIDCSGMARADFFVKRRTYAIYINELNTIPGFTTISMYPKLWEASGVSYRELVDLLIQLAFERHREKNTLRHVYHPSRDWFRG